MRTEQCQVCSIYAIDAGKVSIFSVAYHLLQISTHYLRHGIGRDKNQSPAYETTLQRRSASLDESGLLVKEAAQW
jgi:hypothetical protein